jgi:hypothetical protein
MRHQTHLERYREALVHLPVQVVVDVIVPEGGWIYQGQADRAREIAADIYTVCRRTVIYFIPFNTSPEMVATLHSRVMDYMHRLSLSVVPPTPYLAQFLQWTIEATTEKHVLVTLDWSSA